MSAALNLPPGLTLFPHQKKALEGIFHELKLQQGQPQRSTLLEMATGTGKTVVFAVLSEVAVRHGKRVLVLVHRNELAQQAIAKIQHWTSLNVGLEKAEARASRSGGFYTREDMLQYQPVVVASVQSISKRSRLERFPKDEFGLVICDEAHRSTSEMWQRVLAHFHGAFVLGVTATPDRADRKALGTTFKSVAYTYQIDQAIRDGRLVPIRQHRVLVEGLDLSKLRKKLGDFSAADLEKILSEEKHLHAVADPLFTLAEKRPTLIFGATVAHAKLLADQVSRRADAIGDPTKRCEVIHGETPEEERKQKIDAFLRRDYQFLASCGVFLEGTDFPLVSCIAAVRPTQSRSLYTQMVGRGTRLSPETGKADCLVLDFVGNAGKHALVTAVDIFAGDMTPPERKAAEEIAAANPGLRADELSEMAKKKAAAEARQAEAMRERRDFVVPAIFRTVEVDPFLRSMIGTPTPAKGGGKPVKPWQMNALKRLGVPVHEARFQGIDYAAANAILKPLSERNRKGLCTIKQAEFMRDMGHPDATSVPKKVAKGLIDAGIANGRRIPAHLLPRMREPGEEG